VAGIDQSFDILVSEVGVPRFEHLAMFMHLDRIGCCSVIISRNGGFVNMLPVIALIQKAGFALLVQKILQDCNNPTEAR
jgi:hypothetical protein